MRQHQRPDQTIHVTAAILVRDNAVLIARRKNGCRHAGKWEFPGGKIESGESPEACLVREIREEFNITVAVLEFLCHSIYAYDFGTVQIHAYFIQWLSGELTLNDHDTCAWVSPGELTTYDLLPADVPIAERLAVLKGILRNKTTLAI